MAALRHAALGLGLATSARGAAPACPSGLEPYAAEASPFGWPLAASDFLFGRPECWAERYPLCGGDRQSPMNLDFTLTNAECRAMRKGDDGALGQQAHYKALARPVVSMSSAMRAASVVGELGGLTLKDAAGHDVEYEATSMHLTAPALHALSGEVADAELMVVHRPKGQADAAAGSVVLSVLFRQGEDSGLLSQLGFLPGDDEVHRDRSEWQARGAVDLQGALQGALAGKAWAYDGSMPVPPCTENVRWIVLAEPQGAGESQLQQLRDQLVKYAGGTQQRPAAKRDPNEICREITENSIAAPAAFVADCTHAADRTAACWSQSCDMSPIDVHTHGADESLAKAAASDILRYKAASNVTVAPSAYSLDAQGHFGRVLVGGRSFEASKVSVKAISSHTFDGKRYAGEVVIEHTLFGDQVVPGHATAAVHDESNRRLSAEAAHSPSAGVGGVHKVMVSVPLKLGRESPLLRALGLGVEAHREAIRHGNAYPLQAPVDLAALLQGSTAGHWFWYSGGPTTPGACPAWGVKWMLFQEPLEVSIEQLNFLQLQVSGFDATPMPKAGHHSTVYADSVPARGIVIGSCDSTDPLLNDPACWSSSVATCGGSAQSPVSVRTDMFEGHQKVGDNSFLRKASWKPVSGLRMANDGHSLGFKSNQLGYTTVIGENGFPKFYQVTEVNLKMPSEHALNGRHFAAELQVVQKNQKTVIEYDDDDVIISSVFFDIGEESKLLKQMLGHEIPAPGSYFTQNQPVDLQWALGPSLDGTYYKYDGSYTTPSCAEAVQWVLFETPQTLSREQWEAYKAAFPSPGNNRPLQPLNGRSVARNTMLEEDPIDYRFFLNRQMGRDKRETNPALIAFPIIGTVMLCSISMFAIFQREDKARKLESAGGLEPSTVGKGYNHL